MRRLGIIVLGCGVLLRTLAAQAQTPPPAPPNIVHFQGDDWGWPYYGFVQRYLAAKIASGELVADDPGQRGQEYADEELLLPDTGAAGRPVDQLITPALDWLAANGNFFPIAHNSATISQPAFAVIMTGLYPEDYVLTAENPPKTISPVIPEWLPSEYLTLGAGKWQYAVSHVTVTLEHKRPWDREVGQGGNAGEGGRIVLKPYQPGVPGQQALAGLALQRIKDFIACARCTDPSKCLQPFSNDARDDNPRLGPRADPGACQPQPFFVWFSPFIPHLNYKFDENCPYFPRDAAQCATEPWKSRSVYCSDPSFDWSCGSYSAAMSAALRPGVRRRKVEYLKHINTFDRAVDELMVYLRCPGGGNPDCGEDLFSNTVMLHSGDHGWELRRSKGHFSEHGQRTPKVVYDPRPGNRLPDSTTECGGQPGCRNDFAHAVDILATIKDVSGSTFQCDATCGCSASCPNACPCPRPDGLSRYSEGRSLRAPTQRVCGSGDPSFTQCLFGREKGSQGISQVKRAWDVLAEVTDAPSPTHLCKLYVSCGRRPAIYDLRSDPNERNNLAGSSGTFCGSRSAALSAILRRGISDRGWFDPCFELNLP